MIRKGEPWGELVTLSGDEPDAGDDATAARLIADGDPTGVVVLRDGDLHRSLGGRPGADARPGAGDQVTALPVDLLAVTVDGERHLAIAHVVTRRRRWAGEFAVAMNGTHLGRGNLGPRAHPNDGLVDVTSGRLDLRDRLAARRRAPAGTHVPHPSLTTSRVRSADWQFDRPTTVRVDGVAIGRFRQVHIEVLPDRGRVVVG